MGFLKRGWKSMASGAGMAVIGMATGAGPLVTLGLQNLVAGAVKAESKVRGSTAYRKASPLSSAAVAAGAALSGMPTAGTTLVAQGEVSGALGLGLGLLTDVLLASGAQRTAKSVLPQRG